MYCITSPYQLTADGSALVLHDHSADELEQSFEAVPASKRLQNIKELLVLRLQEYADPASTLDTAKQNELQALLDTYISLKTLSEYQ